jgi:Cu2+-containing amine oxidase
VVRGYCTADNYDYVFDWIFREDGSIQVQATLTGAVNVYDVLQRHEKGVARTNEPVFGRLVATRVTHLPRTEDWPIMPAYTVGFRLVPAGFFSHDPALDTPPSRSLWTRALVKTP